MTISGVLTAMVTPFDADGDLNEEASADLMRHLLENGSDGLVLAGSTGESVTLSDDEMDRLWKLGVAECGDATVIAGTGSNDTRHAVHLTELATEAGVDAVLVVAPYYNKPNQRGLKEHYRAVAAATDKPVILYNIPSRSVIDMPNEFMAELAAEIPNVSAVKQARFTELEPIEGLDLLAGNDDKFAETLDAGGTGGILVASHLVGTEMRRMIDEPDARQEIHQSLSPLFEALNVTTGPIPVKSAMAMLGHDVGGLRLPLVEASEEEKAVVRQALERHGLLAKV
ncbi:MAG TPA: 4-hydroxy-tetrahydrodipicolinate synthase [Thermoleophilaceae bacterium]|jgi:4-hydroxy-tetrahydrodipicolinate synthase